MLQNDVHAVSISLIYAAIFHCIFKHLPGYNFIIYYTRMGRHITAGGVSILTEMNVLFKCRKHNGKPMISSRTSAGRNLRDQLIHVHLEMAFKRAIAITSSPL